MAQAAKLERSTVYLEPELHKALRLKSVESDSSISEIIDDAMSDALQKDLADLQVCEERAKEKTISYETMLKHWKLDGKSKGELLSGRHIPVGPPTLPCRRTRLTGPSALANTCLKAMVNCCRAIR